MNRLFNLNKLTVNKKITLEKIKDKNIQDLYEILSDDEISRFILPKPHETIKETIEIL